MIAGQIDLEVRDPRLQDVVDPQAGVARLATGFGFTEGPIWHPAREELIFSDIPASIQHRWTARDGVSVFRCPSNFANGNAYDRQGRIITCEHATAMVVRHEHGGKVIQRLASHYEGNELNSPNDVVVDRRDRIWFTDPNFGRTLARFGPVRPQSLPFQGVYRLDPHGSLSLVADDFVQPNGLCFVDDERTLLVNDTSLRHIRRFDVDADGKLSGGRVFAQVTGDGAGNPDGLKADEAGRVFCTGPGGVHVFDPGGTCLGVIRFPETVGNFCFGGAGLDTLFVAASTSIYRVLLLTHAMGASGHMTIDNGR